MWDGVFRHYIIQYCIIVLLSVIIVLTHVADAEICGSVAYIYDTNEADAKSFQSLLEKNDYHIELIPLSDVANTDFYNYDLIIIGSDSGWGYEWGDPSSVNAIRSSGKPILGLGYGGSALFQELGMSINRGHAWIGSENSIYVTAPDHPIFNYPNLITVPSDGIIQLYISTGHIGEYAPVLTSDVVLLGREPNDQNHYPLVEEGDHMLWGFTGSPDSMTSDGTALFINIVEYMTSDMSFRPVPILSPNFNYLKISPLPIETLSISRTINTSSIIYYGDGYEIFVKNIDPQSDEVSIELYLDDRIIDERTLKKWDYYFGKNISFQVIDIHQNVNGSSVSIDVSPYMGSAHVILNVGSNPQGAEIWMDGIYEGITPIQITIEDIEKHTLRFVLEGYEDNESTYQFGQENDNPMMRNMTKIQPTQTPTQTSTQPTEMPTQTSTPPTEIPTATTPPGEPGFIAKTSLLTILCGYLVITLRRQI